MECLTSRLTLMMKEVSENRMAEIIDQDRFEKQRITECPQKSRMLLYDKNYPYYNIKEHRRLSLERRQCDISSSNKQKEEQAKEQIAKGKKFKKISTLVTVWGYRPARERKGSVKDDKIKKTRGSNKFLEAAKMAAVISSVEFDNICTSSCGVNYGVHDN